MAAFLTAALCELLGPFAVTALGHLVWSDIGQGRAAAIDGHLTEGEAKWSQRFAPMRRLDLSMQAQPKLVGIELDQYMSHRGVRYSSPDPRHPPSGHRHLVGERLQVRQALTARHDPDQRRPQQCRQLLPAPATSTARIGHPLEMQLGQAAPQQSGNTPGPLRL